MIYGIIQATSFGKTTCWGLEVSSSSVQYVNSAAFSIIHYAKLSISTVCFVHVACLQQELKTKISFHIYDMY